MTVVDIAAARNIRVTRGRSPAYRAEQARVLREQGLSFREIADTLGYSDGSAARKAVERGRAAWMLASEEDARMAILGRVETMLNGLEPLIHCERPNVAAVEAARRLLDLQARLLGLFAGRPSRRETTVEVPNLHAEAKAAAVNEYIELADKLLLGVQRSGYGSGCAPRDAYDDERESDGSGPTMCSPDGDVVASSDVLGDDADDDLGDPPGEWRDGRFYPLLPTVDVTSQDSADAEAIVSAAFDINRR